MLELLVLIVGAMPFLVGLYALKMMREGNDNDSDDPPPPDPRPPAPDQPMPPRPRHARRTVFTPTDRTPIRHPRTPIPTRTPSRRVR